MYNETALIHRWWHEQDSVDTVVRIGAGLDAAYPGARLVAVGQSAAWAVHAAGEIRAAKGQDAQVDYLAFTGSFMRHGPHRADGVEYRLETPDYPREERLADYFDYLAAHEAAPARTAALFNAASGARPSVYIDMICEGLGYASFLSLFLKAADHKIPEGAIFHAFQPPYLENAIPASFNVETRPGHFVRVPLNVCENGDVSSLGYLAGLTGESDVTSISDRLVPTFDISKYGSGHLRHSPNEANVAAIKTAIAQGVARMKV